MKGSLHIEGILYQLIHVDAPSRIVTNALAQMITSSPQSGQIRAILLNGLTFGGFGVVDLEGLYMATKIPIIAVVDRLPNFEKIKDALIKHFEDGEDRWKVFEKVGAPVPIDLNNRQIYIQFHGLTYEIAYEVVKKATKSQQTQPESLRLAHMIAATIGNINRS